MFKCKTCSKSVDSAVVCNLSVHHTFEFGNTLHTAVFTCQLGCLFLPTVALFNEASAFSFHSRWTCQSRETPALTGKIPKDGNFTSAPLKIWLNLLPSLVLQEPFACQAVF